MKVITTQDLDKPALGLVTGENPAVTLTFGDKLTFSMTIGEAAELAQGLLRMTSRPTTSAIAACQWEKCDKVADTVKGGRAYCGEHAKKAPNG